ncbi:disease resistance protein RPV1-like [Cornus florida]|uniref:disease resistance protein RPV1-like n=1 Tax=Cornus florida TaxID=4283 RepID=UPI00289FFEEE|nr:disease resistance protein RPV1-like [Cornus florida]
MSKQRCCESRFIDTIVGEVADKLNPTGLSVAVYPVGIEDRVQQLSGFLKLGSDDVRIVVILGFGGIGKTTIAKAMYNRIHHQFESTSFLANIGRSSSLVELQGKLLRDLLKDGKHRISSEDHGIEVIKQRAWCRRVLLVLDGVDNIRQLRALAINRDLLRPGSRIIVTTRDLSATSSLRADDVYMPEKLSEEKSLQLFSWHAFRTEHPKQGYEILSKEVVSYAKGLPLVLEILGCFLFDKTILEWRDELKKLEKIPHLEVQKILALSLDSLDDKQKGLFLDIACFFVGMDQDLPIKILKGCGFYPESDIRVLSRRCLVSIGRNRLMMHDLIQDMAREIVRQESPEEPGERSRLWYHEDILDGTKAVQGLVLNLPESKELQLNWKAFTKMERLRLLQLDFVHLSGSYEYLSGRLVWLSWKGYPLECIPPTLILDNLVVIDLSYSKLKQVWRGTKVLYKLKYLNLSHSYFLIKTPDFTGLTSLEKLLLNDCAKLVEVHRSVGCLKNLLVLNLGNCKNLKKIPLSVFMLKSLFHLNLSGCSKLDWHQGITNRKLKQAFRPISQGFAIFQGSRFETSFSSYQLSCSIRELRMESCNITNLPSEIGSLVSLEYLNLSRNKFSNLPATITSLPRLRYLVINSCTRLKSLPALPVSLCELLAIHCTSLQSISMESKAIITSLPVLRMRFYRCPKLVNNNCAYNFRRNFLSCQGLREQELHIILPGSEVPRWCNYQSEGPVIRFRVPQLMGGTIQGVILCIVFSQRVGTIFKYFLSVKYCVCNEAKRSRGPRSKPTVPCGAQMCLSYIPNQHLESWLGVGDEVEMKIMNCSGIDFRVKRLGVRLVYEGENHPDSYDDASHHSFTTASNIIWVNRGIKHLESGGKSSDPDTRGLKRIIPRH